MDSGMDAVAGYVAEWGAHGRGVRRVLGLLGERAWGLDELVREAAVPRRVVQRVVELMGPDLDTAGGRYRVADELAGAYRERFGSGRLAESADPPAELVAALAGIVERGPAARRGLDHVAATPETLARRGLWLDSTYDLDGATVLFVGDHDLTSLATCVVNPAVNAAVVDVDEGVLEHIDREARRLGVDVRCYWGDLRFGLPGEVTGIADLVFTDPPYTPEGVRLFLGRGMQGLRDVSTGRLVMAYGYSEQHPGLGLRVQDAVHDLQLVYEAILPKFNRYYGAQAVGSASDLYVCRPTARTPKIVERTLQTAPTNIYTHGAQSLEGVRREPTDEIADQVRDAAAGRQRLPVSARVDDATLGHVLTTGLPPQFVRKEPYAVAVDLSADTGPWLFRALLALNADRVALLVPNNHPDIASESAQQALADAVGGKYGLRFRRSWPDSRHAVVEAIATSRETLLAHAFSRVGNAWGEALVKAGRRGAGPALSRTEARSLATQRLAATAADTLISLPRHRVAEVLAAVSRSQRAESGGQDVGQ